MKWPSKHAMQTILLTNVDNIHLMTGPEGNRSRGNGYFCFPDSPDVFPGGIDEEWRKTSGLKGKQHYQNYLFFPRNLHKICVLLYV